ncbi:hypothetical protein [Actinoplanes teichomyceticus]|uniref:DUF1579 domain-containing protein n=1 Tax=Actinoplanes teichomyceticus TaxID=1867 RepID=A0A561VS54_ACTTI|nr:hypothetical protein [Actinoplanes teichomyceticus]TWG14455.1 hypothetical protein FHX34_104755 [Actinoplanes teichomyceticus]GIF16257.1 hypothetical protein Ate01nite_62890 [Actinoplanes teichomyceticus]
MNDFDFLIGSWNVTNRRLSNLFAGSDRWETFPGTSVCRPVLDGGGNTEEIAFPTLGSHGLTLRLFDRDRKEWSIYWASSRAGTLYPPVVGTFTDGRGDFYGDDVHDGKPIRAHFIWSDITSDSARWEQEFSADGGRTWESNWVMTYRRA